MCAIQSFAHSSCTLQLPIRQCYSSLESIWSISVSRQHANGLSVQRCLTLHGIHVTFPGIVLLTLVLFGSEHHMECVVAFTVLLNPGWQWKSPQLKKSPRRSTKTTLFEWTSSVHDRQSIILGFDTLCILFLLCIYCLCLLHYVTFLPVCLQVQRSSSWWRLLGEGQRP